MKSVTSIINDYHLSDESTLGACNEVLNGEPLTPSINFSTAYSFKSMALLEDYHKNKYNSVRYTRDSSLIVRQLEEYFELMNKGRKVLVYNSGMTAISACLDILISRNTTIVTIGDSYRKTRLIFEHYVNKFSIKHCNYASVKDVSIASDDSDIVVMLETPSNPFVRLVDIEQVRKLLPKSKIIVDITFQGLLNSKSNWRGANFIVSSCTKYIGGHNDVLGGFIACPNKFYQSLWEGRSMRGGIIDNMGAFLVLRSLRTYDLRIEKAIDNTNKVLSFLKDRGEITKIYYPGRYENIDDFELFDKEHYHGGSVITFEVCKSINLLENIDTLLSTKMAPSFGSVDSLIELPAYMSHWGKSEEDLAKIGLSFYTVRLSTGNEPVGYIIDDLKALLK